jgi:hypothetical protein
MAKVRPSNSVKVVRSAKLRTAKARSGIAIAARKPGGSPTVTPLKRPKGPQTRKRPSGAKVVLKHVHAAGASSRTLFAVDAGSKTFGSDLQYAFERNVARARRENMKQFGAADPIVDEH